LANASARDRLIVALDVPGVAEAQALVRTLGDAVSFYKIGLELVMNGGLEFARSLTAEGKRVFLDMKLLDIENTVERAVRAAAGTGATFLTVHGHDTKTLRAAMHGKAGRPLQILAITVLTNLDADDLRQQGLTQKPIDVGLRRAAFARECGCDGVVASGHEARAIRAAIGPAMVIVTPGVRLATDARGDQSRAATPQEAILAGADYLVVGRPISQAADPRRAAETFVRHIEQAAAQAPPSSSSAMAG
jgi:orotidine-5'-phosphate decarboxylase